MHSLFLKFSLHRACVGSPQRGRSRWFLLILSGLLSCMFAACSSNPAARADLQTDSDQTDLDRRARVRLELASAYFGRGMGTTALDEVKQAIVAKPSSAEAFNLRGLIYASLNEPALAEESFQHALKLDSRNFDSMHNYAWFLCQQRRFADADRQFDALVAQPGFRDAARSLLAQGVCQARDNRWPDAEKTLTRAYELDPASPAAAVNLSEVLYRQREYERARFYIRRVNAIDELISAQSLWLALRIENRLRQDAQMRTLGSQLRNRFPDAPETLLYEKGRFDE